MLLVELDHRNNVFEKQERREEARAIIRKGDLLFMIYIQKENTYVFPGGGVEVGESLEETCIRESLEEAGAVVSINKYLGCIHEMWDSKFGDLTYCLNSHYFDCELTSIQEQSLVGYELEIGFTPVWVTAAKALEVNKANTSNGRIRYLSRNTYLLEQLIKNNL